MWMDIIPFLFHNTITPQVFALYLLQTFMDTNKTKRTHWHACSRAEKKEKSQPLLTFHIIAIWEKKKKRLSGIKPWKMSMWVGQVGRRVCLVLLWTKRSRVRTAGRPTDSLRAAGGAPLHVWPRPWCRPGQSLHLGPTYRRSCHRTQSI